MPQKTYTVNFSIEADPEQTTGQLLEYMLNSESTPYPFPEMFVVAMRAFWLPSALHHAGVTEETYTHWALECLQTLRHHLLFLERRMPALNSQNPSGAKVSTIEPLLFSVPKSHAANGSDTAPEGSPPVNPTNEQESDRE